MSKWIAEFELEDGDTMPEHMDLHYKGVRIDFHCKPLEQEPKSEWEQDHAILKAYSDGMNEILDKIRADIQFIKDKCLPNNIAEEYEQKGLQEALDIIDKYKAESEG